MDFLYSCFHKTFIHATLYDIDYVVCNTTVFILYVVLHATPFLEFIVTDAMCDVPIYVFGLPCSIELILSHTVLGLTLLIGFLGLFGHVNILIATITTKSLQTKHGYILCQLSITHIVCIIGQSLNGYLLLYPVSTDYLTCLRLLGFQVIFEFLQASIMVFIAIDLLCAITLPLIYRKVTALQSSLVCILICIMVIVSVTIPLSLQNVIYIDYCNIISLNSSYLSTIFYSAHIFLSIPQITSYAVSYCTVYIRARLFALRNKNACYRNVHRVTMHTISVLIVIYIFTWLTSVLINGLTNIMTPKLSRPVSLYSGLLATLSFSQSFYVYYWRSSEHRRLFKKQWISILHCFSRRHSVKPVTSGTQSGNSHPILPSRTHTALSPIA